MSSSKRSMPSNVPAARGVTSPPSGAGSLPSEGLDVAACERLASRSAGGDGSAWKELVEHAWPFWVKAVSRSRRMGPFAKNEDDVHDVVARLVEKIGRDEGRGLALYVAWRERNPAKTFADWMRIVTSNVVRDYMRERLAGTSKDGELPSPKRLLNEFATSPALDDLGTRPQLTLAQTARQMLEFARKRLKGKQLAALEAWVQGASFEDMEKELGLPSAEAARKLLRGSVAVLRREFGAPGES